MCHALFCAVGERGDHLCNLRATIVEAVLPEMQAALQNELGSIRQIARLKELRQAVQKDPDQVLARIIFLSGCVAPSEIVAILRTDVYASALEQSAPFAWCAQPQPQHM